LSEISKIEFTSAIWKKVRTKEITQSEAQTTLDLFEVNFLNHALYLPVENWHCCEQ